MEAGMFPRFRPVAQEEPEVIDVDYVEVSSSNPEPAEELITN